MVKRTANRVTVPRTLLSRDCDILTSAFGFRSESSVYYHNRQNREGIPQMSLSSYSDVFSISHEREYEEDIGVGDLVRTGPNLFPHFEVVAVHGDKAWVRNVVNGADHLAMISRCRKINGQTLAEAAE